jgi:hypothetical protein
MQALVMAHYPCVEIIKSRKYGHAEQEDIQSYFKINPQISLEGTVQPALIFV